MILYSIIPAEVVFGEYTEKAPIHFFEAEYMGHKVQVVQSTNNEYMITRIFSTKPEVYLNPRLQPGTMVQSVNLKLKI